MNVHVQWKYSRITVDRCGVWCGSCMSLIDSLQFYVISTVFILHIYKQWFDLMNGRGIDCVHVGNCLKSVVSAVCSTWRTTLRSRRVQSAVQRWETRSLSVLDLTELMFSFLGRIALLPSVSKCHVPCWVCIHVYVCPSYVCVTYALYSFFYIRFPLHVMSFDWAPVNSVPRACSIMCYAILNFENNFPMWNTSLVYSCGIAVGLGWLAFVCIQKSF